MQTMRSIAIRAPELPAPIGPYSPAVLTPHSQLLFVSGNFSLKPDITDATHEVMVSIRAVLQAAGIDFAQVVKATIYLVDMDDFAAMNSVYASYFAGDQVLPARETVAVKALPRGAKIEISVIAAKV